MASTSITARELTRWLERKGAVIQRHKGGHTIWRAPNGAMLVTTAAGRGTPPDPRAIKQIAEAFGVHPREVGR